MVEVFRDGNGLCKITGWMVKQHLESNLHFRASKEVLVFLHFLIEYFVSEQRYGRF